MVYYYYYVLLLNKIDRKFLPPLFTYNAGPALHYRYLLIRGSAQ